MAKRAGFLAREMKSMKSDLCFMQERCNILEEENRRLRDGFVKGVPPEEDDLVYAKIIKSIVIIRCGRVGWVGYRVKHVTVHTGQNYVHFLLL